jgi:hypothetical protein
MVSSTSAISCALHFAAQRIVAAAVHRPALDRALDPQKGALSAVEGLVEGGGAHREVGYAC